MPGRWFIRLIMLWGVVACTGSWLTETATAQVKPVRRAVAPQNASYPFRHQISRQNLLRLDRPAPFTLPRPKPAGAQVAPQTLRILAIRVDFPPDTTSKTTGTGRFDLRTPEQFEQEEGHVIDQAPHDRLYFERHLAAMNAYYEAVSYGRFSITFRVFPDALRGAYTLPRQMAYYSPDVDFFDPLKVERLVDFVTDAFATADQDANIVFPDYDAFILFHAGSDLQHDRLQDSPSDLQSGFLRIGDERPPITVDNGAVEIREMILMPETTSQDGNIGALNVTLTHEFGHQLGLPDLYSTFSFVTGVGPYDLMDLEGGIVDIGETEAQIVTGALPVALGAWSRAYLGWTTPLVVEADSARIDLLAAGMQTDGVRLIKIPIAPGEYFLVENRQTDLDGDGVSFLNFEDGIIVGPSDANKQPNLEYDYLLPGSGVVIWHVDENVAAQDINGNGVSNWEENTLQWDELHRFVDIEEADGVQDFGFTTNTDNPDDLFFVGNATLFGTDTRPDSRSYSGANSHVTVRIDSPPDRIMRVAVMRRHALAGWPVAAGPAATRSPVLADVNGDRFLETLMTGADGRLFAWRHDGAGVIPNNDAIRIVSFDGDTVTAPARVFAEASGFLTAPAAADLDNDGKIEVVSTDPTHVYVWNPVDADGDGRADSKTGFPKQLLQASSTGQSEPNVLTPPVLFRLAAGQSGIAVGTSLGGLIALRPDAAILFSATVAQNPGERIAAPLAAADLDQDGLDAFIVPLVASNEGRVAVVDIQGRTVWSRATSRLGQASAPLVTDLDGDGRFDVVVVAADGTVYAWDAAGAALAGWPARMDTDAAAPPAAGDLTNDGLPELVVAGDNRIMIWHGNGAPMTNFPVLVNRANPVGLIRSAPAIGDLDGDAIPEIVVGLPDGTVAAYRRNGQPMDGFPLGTSGPVSSSPALGDLTGSGDIAIAAGSDDGFVHMWTFRGNPGALPWPMLAHDSRRSGASASVSQQQPPAPGSLLVASSVFCYPNPVDGGSAGIRYRLNRQARVRVQIFTLTGDLVEELPGTGYQNQNEVRWDVGRTASGVYLCRVEAQDGPEAQAVFCKIAVVK